MPLPLLLLAAAGGSLLTGAVGAGAAAEAADKRAEAKRRQQRGEAKQGEAIARWEAQRARTDIDLQAFGRLQAEVSADELKRLVVAAAALGLDDLPHGNPALDGHLAVLDDLRQIDFEQLDSLLGHVAVGAAGAAAASAAAWFGAIGAVGAFATASTGTAIGTLTGAAAANATMAWFGGGAVAAGGLGAGLGAVALGGFVAGPAILVGGLIMDAQAEKALEEAKAYERRLTTNARHHDDATKNLERIARCARRMTELLAGLRAELIPLVGAVESYAASGRRYLDLADHERDCAWLTLEGAGAIRDILATPVAGTDGSVNPAAEGLL